jgi:hypothetical protein
MFNYHEFRLPSRWTLETHEECSASYTNDAGDLLSLHDILQRPDIAADVNDADALRRFYRGAAESSGMVMLEVDSARVAALTAVRTIFKGRLHDTGFVYLGSYTLPFHSSAIVIKVQSSEAGVPGAREEAAMVSEARELAWEHDPYEPAYCGQFMRNRADDPKSKVRRYLAELAHTLEVSTRIHLLPPYVYDHWEWAYSQSQER